jgi:hypothetical protein
MAGSSRELQAFAANYARIGAPLIADGTNIGLDAVVERVSSDPSRVTPVVATWPLSNRRGVRVVRLRPAPQYPWYAVWRTASPHPSLLRVLGWLRDSTGLDLRPGALRQAKLAGVAVRTSPDGTQRLCDNPSTRRCVMAPESPDREPRADGPPHRFTPTQRLQVRFVLDFVDFLAARDGFDPAELRDPGSGEPLGPLLARLRAALEASIDPDVAPEPCGSS